MKRTVPHGSESPSAVYRILFFSQSLLCVVLVVWGRPGILNKTLRGFVMYNPL